MSTDNNTSYVSHNQPNVNIGLIGHVSNGKTSIVQSISKKDTKQFKLEKKVGKTVKLGYANAKIWKCGLCKEPRCYSSTDSSQYEHNCECGENTKLVAHISFVDSPGHHSLMSTMLNGTCVTDTTILVESVSNIVIPAQQTLEHLKVANSLGLDNICVCFNKLDLEKKKDKAITKKMELRKALKDTIFENSIIIPLSANRGINVDYLLQKIVEKVSGIKKDVTDKYCRAVIIRSFNVNKQHISIKDIVPGIIGGSIIKGSLQIGDKVTIYPGLYYKNYYSPIVTTITEIHSEKNKLSTALPGGLIALQTDLDPSLTFQDKLAGSCVVKGNIDVKIYGTIRCTTNFIEDEDNIKENDTISVNCNGKSFRAKVNKIKKNKIEINLHDPVCVEIGDRISISIFDKSTTKLTRTGKIIEGIECEKLDLKDLLNMI